MIDLLTSLAIGREAAARSLKIGMAFQNPTMLPWLTIERNVMLPLKIVPPYRSQFQPERKGAFRDRVHALLDKVGLNGSPVTIRGNFRAACCSAPASAGR